MADNKSCEGTNVVWKCIDCGSKHIFRKGDHGQDGLRCHTCNGIVVFGGHTDEAPKPKYTGGVDYATPGKDLTVKVDIDCSDALKGLKAIQREARKATAALKGLEVQQNLMTDLPTCPEVSE